MAFLSKVDQYYINTYGPTGLNILHNFYPFNEPSGSAIDWINANNGSINGAVVQGSPGFLPVLDGDTSYVSSSTNYIVTGAFVSYPLSFEAWIRPTAIGTLVAVITQGSPGVYLGVTGGGYLTLYNLNAGTNTYWSTQMFANNTYHVVITTDGSSTAGNTKGYLNGNLMTQTQFHTPEAFTTPIGVLLNYSGSSVTAFPGKVAKVAIYSAILTPTQVTNNYDVGAVGLLTYQPQQEADGAEFISLIRPQQMVAY